MAVNYEQNFDLLNNGDLYGQDSWYGTEQSPQVQTAIKHAGAKGLEGHYISDYVRAYRDFAGVNGEDHWTKFYIRSSNAIQTYPQVSVGKSYPSIIACMFAAISGYWYCYNGNGAGGGVWLSTGVAITVDYFHVIKIKLNHTTKKWECYIDDMLTPKLSNLGFRHNTSDSLNYIQLYFANVSNQAAKYIDELQIHDYDPDLPVGGFDLLSNELGNNPLMGGGLLN